MFVPQIPLRFFFIPADLVIHEGQTFSIVGYAQVDEWTLVRWRLDFGFDGPNGSYLESETLYRGFEELETDQLRGHIDLYEEPIPQKRSATPEFPVSVWDRVDRRLGKYGMPAATAIALRKMENWCYLQEPREAPI
jgi:hypothetical protein